MKTSQTAGLACMILLLAGCGRSVEHSPNEPSNLQEWAKATRAKPGPPLDPLPAIAPFESFTYSAAGLRDPFDLAGAASAVGPKGPRPDTARVRQPLEAYQLDALRMVGTIGSGAARNGLIMTPDKVTYRVRPGMYIGQNEGRISAISEGKIDVIELTPDGAGGYQQRPVSILVNTP